MQNLDFGFWSVKAHLPLATDVGYAPLPQLAVIRVSGKDAVDFVHGQVTNHVKNIGNAYRLAAYCQPQGRILALMRILKKGEDLYLVMPEELVAGFMKRFSMFILRSDVSLCVMEDWAVAGAFHESFKTIDVDTWVERDEGIIARVPDSKGLTRAMIIGPQETLENQMAFNFDAPIWFATEVAAGLPWIGEKTREAFVPQWINLDKIGGVVFNKGCYPGQEVISRVQHIGTTPRRMARATASSSMTVKPNEDIFLKGVAAGNVVMGVCSANKTALLVEVTRDAIAAGTITVNGADFTIEALTYEV